MNAVGPAKAKLNATPSATDSALRDVLASVRRTLRKLDTGKPRGFIDASEVERQFQALQPRIQRFAGAVQDATKLWLAAVQPRRAVLGNVELTRGPIDMARRGTAGETPAMTDADRILLLAVMAGKGLVAAAQGEPVSIGKAMSGVRELLDTWRAGVRQDLQDYVNPAQAENALLFLPDALYEAITNGPDVSAVARAAEARLAVHDKDHDGILSREELEAIGRSLESAGKAAIDAGNLADNAPLVPTLSQARPQISEEARLDFLIVTAAKPFVLAASWQPGFVGVATADIVSRLGLPLAGMRTVVAESLVNPPRSFEGRMDAIQAWMFLPAALMPKQAL